MEIENKYINVLNNIEELISQKEYTESLFEIDNLLKNDDIPISLSFVLNYKAGILCLDTLNDFDMAIAYLMKTYTDYERIEGLHYIVKYFNNIKRPLLAYSLSLVCLFTKEIPDIGCNTRIYEYERYYIHGLICLNLARYEESIESIKKCLLYLDLEMPNYEQNISDCKEIFEKANDFIISKNKDCEK